MTQPYDGPVCILCGGQIGLLPFDYIGGDKWKHQICPCAGKGCYQMDVKLELEGLSMVAIAPQSSVAAIEPKRGSSYTGPELRREALQEIEKLVCRERNTSYGDAADNFKNIADILNVVLQQKLKEKLDALDVAIISASIKMGRLAHDRLHVDSHLDLAGYIVCGLGIIKGQQK